MKKGLPFFGAVLLTDGAFSKMEFSRPLSRLAGTG